jgi:hypothetical protein
MSCENKCPTCKCQNSGNDPFVRSDEIKSEYLHSGEQAKDVEHALSRLMKECGELFSSNEDAYAFLMEISSGENGVPQ